jgi:hypothetical protein
MVGTTGSTETSLLYVEAPYPSCSNQVSCILFYLFISLNQLWPSPRVMAQLLNDVSICFAEGRGPAESGHRCDWPTGGSFGEVRSVRWKYRNTCAISDTNATTEDTTQSPTKNPWIYKSYKELPAPPKIISTIIIRNVYAKHLWLLKLSSAKIIVVWLAMFILQRFGASEYYGSNPKPEKIA